MLGLGLPVEPTGMIDVAKAEAWLENRRRNVEIRIPANTGTPASAGESLSTQLLAAKVSREQASAALTLVKVGERQGELGLVSVSRAESRRAAEMVRDSFFDFGQLASVSIAGKFGWDLGEVQVHMLTLVRDHLRRQSAAAKAEYDRMGAGA